MFGTIIAGCDGFDRGREAAAFAASVASATHDRVLLVAAHNEPPLPFAGSFLEHRQQVEDAIRRVRDELAPHAATATVIALSPAHALRHVARHEKAGLIVVGSRHRGQVERVVEVDHALQVLHSAPESVAVVPGGPPIPPRLARVAVGLDGSPESIAGVDLAAGLARASGARLCVQVVVDDRRPPWVRHLGSHGSSWRRSLDEQRSAADALLDRALAGLTDVDVEGSVVTGAPVHVLSETAGSSDLLVLGSRRWGPVARLALGSTAEGVVRRGAGAVLVLPRTAHQPQARVEEADPHAVAR